MSKKTRDEQIKEYLLEEEAKANALYPYTEHSIEPIADGAWKGALAIGIPKTIHESFKGGRLSPKGVIGYYGIGSTIGGVIGYLNNKRNVEKARRARRFLINKKLDGKFAKEESVLAKSAALSEDAKQKIMEEAGIEINPIKHEEKKKKSVFKDSLLGGVNGGVIGAAMGLLGGPKRIIRGAISGGVLGAVQTGVGEELEDELKKKHIMDPSTQLAATMAISSATEPIIYRGIGRLGGDKILQLLDDEYKEAVKADRLHNFKGTKLTTKLKHYLLPNIAGKLKNHYDSDNIDIIRGANKKLFDKQLIGHMAGKALWGGLIGYGMGKALEKLLSKKEKT